MVVHCFENGGETVMKQRNGGIACILGEGETVIPKNKLKFKN